MSFYTKMSFKNVILVNYKGNELAVEKYIEMYRIDTLLKNACNSMDKEETKKLDKKVPLQKANNQKFMKELQKNIETIESNFEACENYINNIPGKTVKDLIPSKEYNALSTREKNILNLDRKVEILFDLEFQSVAITKSRTLKQRFKDANGVDEDDVFELLKQIGKGGKIPESNINGENPVIFKNINRDFVVQVLQNTMKAFPKNKMESQYLDC